MGLSASLSDSVKCSGKVAASEVSKPGSTKEQLLLVAVLLMTSSLSSVTTGR